MILMLMSQMTPLYQIPIYYKYGVLGAIRAIDYIFSRSDFNGSEMGVMGVSQGGGLAYLVAGVDDRVNLLLNSVPALGSTSWFFI